MLAIISSFIHLEVAAMEDEVFMDIFRIHEKFSPGSSLLRTQGSLAERNATAVGN